MINLDAYVADVQPSVSKVETHEVSFDGGFLKGYTERFSRHIVERMHLLGASNFELCPDTFNKYLNTLLKCRIEIANSTVVSIPRSILKVLYIPAVHQLALAKIGWVQDQDTKEVFVPKLTNMNESDFLGINEMVEFSSKLALLADFGIEVNPGFNLNRDGNLHFMTWKVISESVKSYWREKNDAPASDAILLSFFNVQDLENVIRPKFYYGNSSYYETLLDAVFLDCCRNKRSKKE